MKRRTKSSEPCRWGQLGFLCWRRLPVPSPSTSSPETLAGFRIQGQKDQVEARVGVWRADGGISASLPTLVGRGPAGSVVSTPGPPPAPPRGSETSFLEWDCRHGGGQVWYARWDLLPPSRPSHWRGRWWFLVVLWWGQGLPATPRRDPAVGTQASKHTHLLLQG